jgi:N-methylhydantoinase B
LPTLDAVRTPDPITLEIVRHAVYSIADEMRVIVMRSARSPLLKEAGDLSCVPTE